MTTPAPTLDADGREWVNMQHPATEAPPTRVTRAAFDAVWSDKGWQLVDDETAAVAAATGTTDLSRLTKAELVEQGAALGLDLSESTAKADLIAAVTSASVQ